MSRQSSRPAPSAMRGPESSPALQLIPTPSGPGSGAATPGTASPLPCIAPAAGGCSSNVHHPRPRAGGRGRSGLNKASGLLPADGDGAGSPPDVRRVKRPADVAAEELAAEVLAAHKVGVRAHGHGRRVWPCPHALSSRGCRAPRVPPAPAAAAARQGLTRRVPARVQGNWVSALHKLASAVGRQLASARAAAVAAAAAAERDQAPPADAQSVEGLATPALAEPEIAVREARLRRVLVNGTHAARALTPGGAGAGAGVGGATPAAAGVGSGGATPVSGLWAPPPQLGGAGAEPQAAPPAAARQLQLMPDCLPGGDAAAAAPFASPGGAALPQAWPVGAAAPHQRPRLGPSRLAQQTSIAALGGGPFAGMFDPAAAAGFDSAAAAAAGVTAFACLPPLPVQLPAGASPLPLNAAAGPGAGHASPVPAGVAQLLAARHAAGSPASPHYDEPIISLRDARRDARSRSETPAAAPAPPRAPPAAAPAVAAMGAGDVHMREADLGAAAFADALGAEGPHVGGAHMQLHMHEEEDADDGPDPIEAHLAAAAGGGRMQGLGPA